MSQFRESVGRILEGTLVIVFSVILVGAGSIVWKASTSYKDDMKAYFEASTEVFSTDVAELSSGQRSLKEALENQNAILTDMEHSLDELWNLANFETDYDEKSMIESNDMDYGGDSMLEEIVVVADELRMSEAPPPVPLLSERVVRQQQQIPQDYQTYKKADIMNRIQQTQQQIQQQK